MLLHLTEAQAEYVAYVLIQAKRRLANDATGLNPMMRSDWRQDEAESKFCLLEDVLHSIDNPV